MGKYWGNGLLNPFTSIRPGHSANIFLHVFSYNGASVNNKIELVSSRSPTTPFHDHIGIKKGRGRDFPHNHQ